MERFIEKCREALEMISELKKEDVINIGFPERYNIHLTEEKFLSLFEDFGVEEFNKDFPSRIFRELRGIEFFALSKKSPEDF